jgi:hypothetical protein
MAVWVPAEQLMQEPAPVVAQMRRQEPLAMQTVVWVLPEPLMALVEPLAAVTH